MKTVPWTFLLLAAGIVLIAGDGYFDGQTAVGVLSILAGFGRALVHLVTLSIAAKVADAVQKAPPAGPSTRFKPPTAPRNGS